jgi:hypothetical protein
MNGQDRSIAVEIHALDLGETPAEMRATAPISAIDLTIPEGQSVALLSTDTHALSRILDCISGADCSSCSRAVVAGEELHGPSQHVLRTTGAPAQSAAPADACVLFIEEPTETPRELVCQAVSAGQTVIVATRVPEYAMTCERIVILRDGRLAADYLTQRIRAEARPEEYSIEIAGRIDPTRSSWFAGLDVRPCGDTTFIEGPIPDQAALFGVLSRIHDLGLDLKCVKIDSTRILRRLADEMGA